MKVNKQQKILGCVLVIGAIALCSDRLFFLKSGPAATESAAASASEYAVAPAAASAAPTKTTPITASTPVASVQNITLSQRLRNAAAAQTNRPLKDAFAFSSAWGNGSDADNAAPASASAGEVFKQSHRLTGVLSSNGRAVAMVDGKLVPVGQSVDGYRLVSISHRSATFESAHSQVILNLAERAVSGNPVIAGAGQ